MSAVERRVAAAAERVARVVAEAVPGVQAEAQVERVVVTGRGLRRRLLKDARLRWIGGLVR